MIAFVSELSFGRIGLGNRVLGFKYGFREPTCSGGVPSSTHRRPCMHLRVGRFLSFCSSADGRDRLCGSIVKNGVKYNI